MLEDQDLLGPDGLPPDRDPEDPPILVAWSDNGSETIAVDTRQFMALMAIAQHHGRPGTPTDQAHIESFFSHLKGDWPHLTEIRDPAALDAELARIRREYNTVRLDAAIGYVTPDDEHHGRGQAIRRAAPPACAAPRRADQAESSQQEMSNLQNTDRAHAPLVETGESRNATTERLNRSTAIVNSKPTHRNVTRVHREHVKRGGVQQQVLARAGGDQPPIRRAGTVRDAALGLRADPPARSCRAPARRTARLAFHRFGTTSGPCCSAARASTRSSSSSCVGRLAPTCSSSTARSSSSQRGSIPRNGSLDRWWRASINPASPSRSNARTQRRRVVTPTPSSSAFAR